MSAAVSISEERSVQALGETIILRRAHERDRGYVLSSWLRTYLDRRPCEPGPYFAGHRKIAERQFDAGNVWVAHSERSPMTAHGWICGLPGLLHYVYVPSDVRRQGFGKTLIREVCGEAGTRTHKWPSARIGGWVFDPYRAWETTT